MTSALLEYRVDDYNCVQVIDDRLIQLPVDTKWFDKILKKSIKYWNDNNYKAIWLQLSSPRHTHLISYAINTGFYPHHCESNYIMLVLWLNKNLKNQLPLSASHFIGVGGVIINSKNEILMVQETTGPASKYKIWKLPGGLVDSNEMISNAVIRELFEETGINTKFIAFGSIIEMYKRPRFINKNQKQKINSFYVNNPSRGNRSTDIYCMCLCELIDNENNIKLIKQKNEIADIKWIPISDIFKMSLWKINSGVWSAGLKKCIDIHNGKSSGLNHSILPIAFRRGEASIYMSKL